MSLYIMAVAFVAVLVVLSAGFEYWQSKKRGLSHDESVHESMVAGGFLSGSAVFGYIVSFII